MTVYTPNDQRPEPLALDSNFGNHRFSCFEPMVEATALLWICAALITASIGVVIYTYQDPRREIFTFGAGLIAALFSFLAVPAAANALRAKQQLHFFENGITQTTFRGQVLCNILYADVVTIKIDHSFSVKNQIDRYEFYISNRHDRIKFSDHAPRFEKNRSEKLKDLVSFLKLKMPREVTSAANASFSSSNRNDAG